jgi:hypothetical protein
MKEKSFHERGNLHLEGEASANRSLMNEYALIVLVFRAIAHNEALRLLSSLRVAGFKCVCHGKAVRS